MSAFDALMTAPPPKPPDPGWYLDPDTAVRLRFHDGTGWTDQARVTLPDELEIDERPAALGELEHEGRDIQRNVQHSAWLLGASLLLIPIVFMASVAVLAGVALAKDRRARTAWHEGALTVARRRYRSARRWRLAAYWSIPVWILSMLLLAAVAFNQWMVAY